jgi:hypothetical protein
MSLRVWRYPIIELWVPIGYPGRAEPLSFSLRFHLGKDYFGFPLSYDDFTTGASEPDILSDEIYCPCGVTMPWGGDAGDLLRRIDDHCKATPGHPMPVRSEAF